MIIATGVLAYLLAFIAARQFYPEGILFYQGIALSILIPTLQAAIIHLWRRSCPLVSLKDFVITFLLTYSFLVTIPTNADRSFSIRMLQRVELAPNGLTREEIGELYTVDFVARGGLDKRLMEQQASGTMREEEGRYVLTTRGESVCVVSRVMCQVFVCRRE